MSVVTPKQMEQILRNLFNGGKLERLPKNRRHAEALLALAAASLDSQSEFTEPELNSILGDWLADFADPVFLDHVTVRRYLVDLGMLLRDAEGSRYRTNQPVIGRIIEASTRSVNPRVVYQAVQAERALRRRQVRE